MREDFKVKTPKANRIHIGVFGRTNSGKSFLVNKIVGSDVSIVSDKEGTTTDPVYKSMELHPIGPVVFVDTAGFCDDSVLGYEREARTKKILEEIDIAVILFDGNISNHEYKWYEILKNKNTPLILAVSKGDIEGRKIIADEIEKEFNQRPLIINPKNSVEELKSAIINIAENFNEERPILGGLVETGDVVMLVMPQDIQAPKGRLILPQVQTIREILDREAIPVCCTRDNFHKLIEELNRVPKLIITDSQLFKEVKIMKPEGSLLTSFSVLFAAHKGDIKEFIRGARAIDGLRAGDRVLIAEACTHSPLEEDIGREKIPKMLQKKYGDLDINICSGKDFPTDLDSYDLIIHCGGCMFNSRYMMSRVEKVKENQVPITNYGIAIAHLKGILEEVVY